MNKLDILKGLALMREIEKENKELKKEIDMLRVLIETHISETNDEEN